MENAKVDQSCLASTLNTANTKGTGRFRYRLRSTFATDHNLKHQMFANIPSIERAISHLKMYHFLTLFGNSGMRYGEILEEADNLLSSIAYWLYQYHWDRLIRSLPIIFCLTTLY